MPTACLTVATRTVNTLVCSPSVVEYNVIQAFTIDLHIGRSAPLPPALSCGQRGRTLDGYGWIESGGGAFDRISATNINTPDRMSNATRTG